MKSAEDIIRELDGLGVKLRVEGEALRYKGPKGAITGRMREIIGGMKAEIMAAAARMADDILPPVINRERGEGEALPLSFAQLRLWFLYRMEGPSPTYNVPSAHRIKGKLDIGALTKSVNHIIARHEPLRMRFFEKDGEAYQAARPVMEIDIPVVRLAADSHDARMEQARRMASQEALRPFDLAADPLIRVSMVEISEDDRLLLITLHHIIADGWSATILTMELERLYDSYLNGASVNLPSLGVKYSDYCQWQKDVLVGERLDRQVAVWTEKLKGAPALHSLPLDRPRPALQSFKGESVYFTIGADLTGRLKAFCRQEGVSLFMATLAAFAAIVAKYGGKESMVIGVPAANRLRKELEPLIGLFVNTIPLRVEAGLALSFRELAARTREVTLDSFSGQQAPFEKLVDVLQPDRNMAYNPLTQLSFILQDKNMGTLKLGGIAIEPFPTECNTAKCDLTLTVQEGAAGLDCFIAYASDIFCRPFITGMARHYQNLIDRALGEPDRPVGQLDLMDGEERRLALTQWSGAAKCSRHDGPLAHEMIGQAAKRHPDAMAVSDGASSLTYAQLDARALAIAKSLAARGAGPDKIIGICLERSVDLIAAILGVWKAGGAYMPIDPDFPPARMKYMVENSGAVAVITSSTLEHAAVEAGAPLVFIDRAFKTSSEPVFIHSARPENLAYVIYTSGSTGQPKGVMIEHRSLRNLVHAVNKSIYEPYEGRLNVALLASEAFDASVKQIATALCLGHTLFVVDGATKRDDKALKEFFRKHRIDMTDCTPSLLSVMINAGIPGDVELRLKHIDVGGEALTKTLAANFHRRALGTGVTLTNAYGPAECCVDAANFNIDSFAPGERGIVPVGAPLQNVRIYILDGELAPVPPGVPGEICIAGEGVGRGYINNPALTAERFIGHGPLGEARLYRTGDIGRWSHDGMVEFIGRADGQVKVRGYRIELGEVEAALKSIPGVKSAAVAAVELEDETRRLEALLQVSSPVTPGGLRATLLETLPEYMVPSRFYVVDSISLNTSGKLDRGALAAMKKTALDSGEEFMAPRGQREEILAEVWRSVLGLDRVSIRDNFFTIGGDSIKALQIAARLRERNFEIAIRDLFSRPTIEGLEPLLKAVKPEVDGENSADGPVHLTPIQLWFFGQFGGNKAHFNQTLLLAAKERLDEAALRKALEAATGRHDALRSRFFGHDGKWTQEIGGTDRPFRLDVVDLTAEEHPAGALKKHASLLQAGIDMERGPLFNAAIYRLKDGDRLFMTCHHLVVDAVSWRFILEDLAAAYQQASKGMAPKLPPKPFPLKKWAAQLSASASSIAAGQMEHWSEVEAEAVKAPRLAPFKRGLYSERTEATRLLGADATSKMLDGANKAFNTRPQELMLTALLRTFQKLGGGDSMAVTLEGHGREGILPGADVSGTAGWFTSKYPVVFTSPDGEDIASQIKAVKEAVRRTPHGGAGYGVARYMAGQSPDGGMWSDPEILFNYLGGFEELDNDLFGRAFEDVGPHASPDARVGCGIELVSYVSRGNLEISVYCDGPSYTEGFAGHFAERYIRELESVAEFALSMENPQLTPSDIDYDGFGIAQLDEFINKL
ncbi:MAG: amino acid adenylation domain-containing protein [Nitrospinae bacterium]|nr:amino acid adenylation domain-containing protein [Nitrospinota bacterium]